MSQPSVHLEEEEEEEEKGEEEPAEKKKEEPEDPDKIKPVVFIGLFITGLFCLGQGVVNVQYPVPVIIYLIFIAYSTSRIPIIGAYLYRIFHIL